MLFPPYGGLDPEFQPPLFTDGGLDFGDFDLPDLPCLGDLGDLCAMAESHSSKNDIFISAVKDSLCCWNLSISILYERATPGS